VSGHQRHSAAARWWPAKVQRTSIGKQTPQGRKQTIGGGQLLFAIGHWPLIAPPGSEQWAVRADRKLAELIIAAIVIAQGLASRRLGASGAQQLADG